MNIQIPPDSLFRPCLARFTAVFNNPAPGQYDFGVAGNKEVTLLNFNNQNLYLISILNFSANVPESVFVENVLVVPQIRFATGQNKKPLDGGAYPLAQYLIDNEVGTFFYSRQGDDTLTATFTGLLGQNADILPFGSITAVVGLNIWEIHDRTFIDKYHHNPQTAAQASRSTIPRELDRRI